MEWSPWYIGGIQIAKSKSSSPEIRIMRVEGPKAGQERERKRKRGKIK
jgi:hypothetical protein